MLVDTNEMFSMTQANLNFSLITRTVEKKGKAVISKNSKLKYLVIPIDKFNQAELDELDRLINRINS